MRVRAARQTVWSAARLLTLFGGAGEVLTIASAARQLGLDRGAARRRLDALRRAGLAERLHRGCYRLTEAGLEAKAVGEAVVKPGPRSPRGWRSEMRSGALRARLWQALRAARKATVPELVAVASRGGERAAENNARHYLEVLYRAGYVAQLKAREPGHAARSPGFVRWLLVRDTGPKAPVHCQGLRELFDPNTGQSHQLQRTERTA